MGSFEGKVAFITGASSGIGAALARELAREGADLALLARRVDRLQVLSREVAALGRRALVLAGDVCRDGDLEQAVARTREEFGRLDLVVANAGFGVVGLVEKLSLDDYRRQFETNVFGVLRTIQATLEDLKRSRGALVIVGSVSGYVSLAAGSAYSMSKAALRPLADSLRAELRPFGVSVTLISPGFVESEIRQVDNRGQYHPDAPDVVPRWLRMPAERAARQILRAVRNRRSEAVLTGHGKVLVFLQRHVPGLLGLLLRLGPRARLSPGE
jgi:short-subunit dehydrogenase